MTIDSDWIFSSFLVPDQNIDSVNVKEKRYWSSADTKFTDTEIGGSFCVNPLPQFTRYADPRSLGTGADTIEVSINSGTGRLGLGHYYSEAIDDPNNLVYFRMGVPQFNSLTNFITKCFDPALGTLVNTGKGRSAWFTVVETVFSWIPIRAFPVASILFIAGKALGAVFTEPTSKYYTMKPTMHTYWRSVDTLVNSIAANMGLLPRFMMPATVGENKANKNFLDKEFLDHLHNSMPNIFTEDYAINVMALANNAQRAANAKFLKDYNKLNNASASSYDSYVANLGKEKVQPVPATSPAKVLNAMMMGSYWIQDAPPPVGDEAKNFTGSTAVNPMIDPATGEHTDTPKEKDNIIKYFDAEMREGSQFACFRFDNITSVSESWSNSVGEPEIASKINSTVSTVREIKFGLADGNIIGGNAIGDAIQGVAGLIKDTGEAALSGITLGFSNIISQFFAGSYMDFPNTWKNSTVKLPSVQYSVTLTAPYNNVISRLQNIYIPVAMFMAMSLPRSTGKTSYGSPNLIQVFQRGINQVSLGMVESLSFTRGVNTLPFVGEGQVMGIEVSLNIVDLSTIMHMPIDTSGIFGGGIHLDEDNTLFQYLAALAGQDLYSQLYSIPKAKINAAKRLKSLDTYWSAANWGAIAADWVKNILPIDRIIEGREDIKR